MRHKIYNVLKNIYGICMTVSFFAGFLPLIPFIIAIIIGGESAEAISLFLHKQYYPWVIALASVAVIIGLIAMYIGKLEGLSVKKISANDSNVDNASEENSECTDEVNDTAVNN
jgi:amino acid permease